MLCDFYEPESDEFLKCQYVFKVLYILRDSYARNRDIPPLEILSDQTLYAIARTKSLGEPFTLQEKPGYPITANKLLEQVGKIGKGFLA